jgi:excisionase family DNA binding protein
MTPNQVAALLKVSAVTVRHWSLAGKLKFVTTPGGHRRYTRNEIERFARENDIKLEPTRTGEYRILIVDDNVDLAVSLSEALTMIAAHTVSTDVAHDGYSAGEKLHIFRPDVILLDLFMPGLNGFATCRRIKGDDSTKHIRIIAMTGTPTSENVEQILAYGADACLAKPFRIGELLETLGLVNPDNAINENDESEFNL